MLVDRSSGASELGAQVVEREDQVTKAMIASA